MDPLSFTASLVTLLALATKTTLLTQQILSSTKEAPSELTELRNEVASLIWVTSRLDALAKEEAKTLSPSQQQQHQILWLQNPSSQGEAKSDIDVALETCTKIMIQLTAKLDVMARYITSSNPLDKVKFPIFVTKERSNLKDLRTKLVQSKTAILMCLQMRTFDMLKTASSASSEHTSDIQELLKLVRSLKTQDQNQSQNQNQTQTQDQTTVISGVLHHTIEPAPTLVSAAAAATAPTAVDAQTSNDTSGITAVVGNDGGNAGGGATAKGIDKKSFDLEIHSGPEAWMQKFI